MRGPVAVTCSSPFLTYVKKGFTSLAGSRLETCLIALQTDAHLRGSLPAKAPNTPDFFSVWREIVPTGVAAGERLFASGTLLALSRSGADVQRAVDVIEKAVEDAS
jgi:hypothetical protein